MRLDLSAPDYTTLSRRSQHLRRRLRPPVPPDEGLHLVLDSTGLSIVGAGEWAAAKHGGRGRRGWRKLHLGVDQSGAILAHTLTEATGDDATTALDLLTAVEGPLVRITADAAYDTVAVYETATARGATVVIPPARTANVSGYGPRSPARDRTITLVKQLGRRRWKKTSGYHRQSRVENTFFRYKSIIGDGLRARSPAGQGSEVVLGCEILNRMTELGPTSVISNRPVRILSVGIVRARDDSCNNASRRAHRVETAIAFRLHNALGTQNERYFVAVNPTAHSLACLRIGVFVTADAARLATGVGGSPFTGRVSHPLDGKQSFMTSPHRHSPLTSLAWSHCAPTPHAIRAGRRQAWRWVGRTSVSPSWKVTGHFFRLDLRPWCPGSGHNRRIL